MSNLINQTCAALINICIYQWKMLFLVFYEYSWCMFLLISWYMFFPKVILLPLTCEQLSVLKLEISGIKWFKVSLCFLIWKQENVLIVVYHSQAFPANQLIIIILGEVKLVWGLHTTSFCFLVLLYYNTHAKENFVWWLSRRAMASQIPLLMKLGMWPTNSSVYLMRKN